MASQWVTVYYLSFSVDGIHFARYRKNSRDKVSKVFRVVHPIRLPFDKKNRSFSKTMTSHLSCDFRTRVFLNHNYKMTDDCGVFFNFSSVGPHCVTSGEDEDCVTSAKSVFIGGNCSPARTSFKDSTKRLIKMSHSLFTPILFRFHNQTSLCTL